MSRIGEFFGIFSSKADRKTGPRREPELEVTDWQSVKDQVQAEVRSLVSKSIVESVFYAPPRASYEDREAVLQATANRLYADALFEISSRGVTPPFEPSEEIMLWVREALEESVTDWRHQGNGAENGGYEPPVEAKRSTTDAICAALERASKNGILQKAAKQRIQATAEMVAGGVSLREPGPR